MTKLDWEIEIHQLIADYKLPDPYLDDDYLDLDELYEAGYTPEEAVRALKFNGEL